MRNSIIESYAEYQSPIGTIRVVSDEIGVKKIELFEEDWREYLKNHPSISKNQELCSKALKQLDEYFQGKRKKFDLSLSIDGTVFRRKVWSALLTIPYGEVRSYAEVAEMIGNPKATRAIGQANKANQLPILIPCHRVIGKSGDLVGYAGNRTPYQQRLLEVEGYLEGKVYKF